MFKGFKNTDACEITVKALFLFEKTEEIDVLLTHWRLKKRTSDDGFHYFWKVLRGIELQFKNHSYFFSVSFYLFESCNSASYLHR